MARRILVGIVALASTAVAGGTAPAPSWADWVGDWQGKLAWSSCTTDGQPKGTLALDATDGAIAIDLTGAGGALGPMSLLEERGGWSGQRGDVRVHVAHGKAEALDVAVDLDSGCQLRASLRRVTTGIGACDRLNAWARVEGRCTKLLRAPLENASRLARQRESWADATGDARVRIAAQCEARASKVEAELVDAGCAPSPDPAIGMRGAECRSLAQATAKLGRCANVPHDLATTIAQEASALVGAAQQASESELPYVEGQCRHVREQIAATAQQSGCPLM